MKSAIAVFLALGLTGCFVAPVGPKDRLTDSGLLTDSGPGDSGPTGDSGPGCTSSADCPPGDLCLSNVCTPVDAFDGSGGDFDQVPDSGPACLTNSDCSSNESCVGGVCVPEGIDAGQCVFDSDCGPCAFCNNGQCMGAGCDDGGPVDSGPVDAGHHRDAGPVDAGQVDAGQGDAGPVDAGQDDAGPVDAGPVDAGRVDAGPVDAGPVDAGPIDAGPVDAGPVDAGTAVCGNGVVEGSEQCDLGNLNGTGAGCTRSCRFECQMDSDCASSVGGGGECLSPASCVSSMKNGETVQSCQAGSDLPACTTCSNGFCNGRGACKASTCGDSCVDTAGGEQCDFGSGNNASGSGCEPGCMFSCSENPDSCAATSPCEGAVCGSVMGPNGGTGQACGMSMPVANGTACGSGDVCIDTMCVPPTCGDGVINQTSEECDLGSLNGQGVGCSSSCTFDCGSDSDCPAATACQSAQKCTAEMFDGQTVKECLLGTTVPACSPCNGMSGLCNSAGQCAASTCGDGCVDTTTGEECDDSNQFDLDGCSSTCAYEVVGRMTSVSISGSRAPSFCTPATNAFGTQVLTSQVLGQINGPLQTDVTDGVTNVMTQMLGMTDLTGTSAQSNLQLGVVTGALDPRKGTWPANNPIDWWFLADPSSIASGLPNSLMPASISSSGALLAGPADVSITLNLAGTNALLTMRDAQITGSIDSSPAADQPAPPPAKLAPGLTVFQDVTASGMNQGLCGNITVESLSQIPIPQVLATGGQYACGQSCFGNPKTYTYCGANQPVGPNCNSMLDLIVGGCQVEFCLFTAANPTQPDVAANGHSVAHLTLGSGNKVPTSQTNGDLDGYSSYLQFDANRAHFTGETCNADSDCQSGQSCNSICR